ncbi:guanine nucleotide exchange factor [Anaeramoeba flamelloides]|uniref:Guanine nucleotide exchange factor n=1 Tax=Anaeramoeba flamelloides TaxID=1746091 RepID=A0AAV7YAD4_9EUKA|nr:guanine nucleotide exchange factor [Anaeramoeba flamelloides]
MSKNVKKTTLTVTIQEPNGKSKKYNVNSKKTTISQLHSYIFRSKQNLLSDYKLFCCFRKKRVDTFDDVEGSFLTGSEQIGDYLQLRIQLRKKCHPTIRVKITNELDSSSIDNLTFQTKTKIRDVLTQLEKCMISNEHSLSLVLRKANEKEKGTGNNNNNNNNNKAQNENHENIIPFFPFNNLKSQGSTNSTMKKLVRSTNIFGIYLDAKEYTISHYLSLFGSLGYTKLIAEAKPIWIYITLPSKPVFQIIVRPNIKLKSLTEKLLQYYHIKRKENLKEIPYTVYHLIYEHDLETNSMVLSEVTPLKEQLTLYENLIIPNSHLKFVKSADKSDIQENLQNRKKKVPTLLPNHPLLKPNINLWEEIGNVTWNLILNKHTLKQSGISLEKRIKGATLNRTVAVLTSPKTFNKDLCELLIEPLLLISKDLFIKKLIERFHVPEIHPRTKNRISGQVKKEVQTFVCTIFLDIVTNYLKIVSIKGRELLIEFIQNNLQNHKIYTIHCYGKLLSRKLGFMDFKLREKEGEDEDDEDETENILNSTNILLNKNFNRKKKKPHQIPQPYIPKELDFKKLDLFKIHSIEVARQLSQNSFEIFYKLQPRELFDKAWIGKNKAQFSPNVVFLTNKFERITALFETEILSQPNKKKRVKMVEKILQIAMHLRKMNNFEDLTAIISALESPSISRLYPLWNKVGSSYKNWFKTTCNQIRNVNSSELLNLFKKSDPPTIPYLGVLLIKATHVSEISTEIRNGLINWNKICKFNKIAKSIKHFQSEKFYYEKVDLIQKYLLNSDIWEESIRWKTSLKYLPLKEEK